MLKMEISRCRLADYDKECYSTKVRAARAARLFFLINQSDHCFLALSLLSPCLRPCLNSLINFMKQRLGADESYVDGYVKSVFHDFHGILWLLRKVKAILFT